MDGGRGRQSGEGSIGEGGKGSVFTFSRGSIIPPPDVTYFLGQPCNNTLL